LAKTLEVSLAGAPEDETLKSALADCLLQLARFRIPPHNPSDREANLVAEEDVGDVRQWLDRSAELLGELLERHPNNRLLAARAAACRVSMQKLPGTWQERSQHVAAAGQLSSHWDTAHGAVRFSLEPVLTASAEAGASELSLLEQRAQNGSIDARLKLAHAYCERKQYLLAISEYQTALSSSSNSAAAFAQAFYDLAQLAEHEPGAVELAIAKHWPRNPQTFYYGMLGIRLADIE
jgi:tetratricopeptide (TPR) repeat protein